MHAYISNYLYISYYTGIPNVPAKVPDVTVIDSTITVNRLNVTLTLSWGVPFNNFDPIVNYTVSCSGDIKCPPHFTTTDNITRSYTITNLTTITTYIFSVVATNSNGSGEPGVVNVTTPSGKNINRAFTDNSNWQFQIRILVMFYVLTTLHMYQHSSW